MFTGIVEAIGCIERLESRGSDLVLTVQTGKLDLDDVRLGDSIAVNGVCLTVVALTDSSFTADVSSESLVHTNFGTYTVGSKVNLEKALTLSSRLGGHLVSGHVDGIGTILDRSTDGRSIRFDIQCSSTLAKYIAEKGSITVDGVSLTVTGIVGDCGSEKASFSLNIIPHTEGGTIIYQYQKGQTAHLEVDLIARYTERLLDAKFNSVTSSQSNIDLAFLSDHGFLR